MKRLFLDNFWLKIIAVISMTIAHVGNFMFYFGYLSYDSTTHFILDLIGKIAFPIFIFLLIEGVNHTRSKKNYLSRLLLGAIFIYLCILVINLPQVLPAYEKGGIDKFGNIFIDLFMLGLTYTLFTSENKKTRWFSLIPIAYILGISSLKFITSMGYVATPKLHYLYDGFYMQYDLVGLLLLFGFHFAYKINDLTIKKALNNPELELEFRNSPNYQFRKNCAASISVLVISIICYLISIIPDTGLIRYMDLPVTTYIALAGLFIPFYSGRLGIKNKYIQGAFYLYYPLHLAIIFLIFYFI